MAGYIVFCILCFVILFFTLRGVRQGFLRIAFSLAAVFLSLWLVTILSPHVSRYLIEHTGAYDQIYERLLQAFSAKNEERDNSIAENQVETIRSYALPDPLKDLLIENNNTEVYNELLVTFFEDYVARFLSRLFLKILTYVIIFLIIMAVFRLTLLSLDVLDKLPILHGLNRIAGALAGFLEGFIVVWLFFLFMTALYGNAIGQAFFGLVETNPMLKLFYENNYFLRFIDGARVLR